MRLSDTWYQYGVRLIPVKPGEIEITVRDLYRNIGKFGIVKINVLIIQGEA